MWIEVYVLQDHVVGKVRADEERIPRKWDPVIMVISAVVQLCLCVEMENLRMHIPIVPHVAVQGDVKRCGSSYDSC